MNFFLSNQESTDNWVVLHFEEMNFGSFELYNFDSMWILRYNDKDFFQL